MLLQNQNAVIYGGGGAVARVFAREGARVFIAGRTVAKLDRVAGEIAAAGGAVEIAQLDALDQDAVNAHAAAVADKAGSIDIALNTVSFMHNQGTTIQGLSLDDFMLPSDRFLRAIHNDESGGGPYGQKASRRDPDPIHTGGQLGCRRKLGTLRQCCRDRDVFPGACDEDSSLLFSGLLQEGILTLSDLFSDTLGGSSWLF